MKNKILVVLLCFLPANAFSLGDGGAGWAQIGYLIKVLDENYKRYEQLKTMLKQAKHSDNYFKTLHQGLENITGLMEGLPVSDQGVLNELRSFNSSLKTITRIYGRVPHSPLEALHILHDQTAAESLQMVNSFKQYSKTQESNSRSLKVQSQAASPKGAARATAVSNAMILDSTNKLIHLQSQSLKMQSEQLAMLNKQDKGKIAAYQKVDKDIGNAFKNFKRQDRFVKF
ncbi:MAG: hypothetical protein OYH77_08970 [Pseudomonadota bacterium]|nr:hypothetical protein [Pseudomonadota bacterium]